MELVYLWVEDYKNIKKQGFNFSPRFECKFHDEYEKGEDGKDNCKLEIRPKEHIENFFGENINITAIVGKNGSGKSSVLEFFYIKEERKKFIIIIEFEDALYYLSNFKFNTSLKIKISQDLLTFYNYSNEKIDTENKICLDKIEILKMIMYNYTEDIGFQLSTFMFLPNKIEIVTSNISEKIHDFISDYTYNYGKGIGYPNYDKNKLDNLFKIKDGYHLFLMYLNGFGTDIDTLLDKSKLKSNFQDITESDFSQYFNNIEKVVLFVNNLSDREKNIYIKYNEFFEFDFIDKKERRFNNLSHGERTLFGQLLNIFYIVTISEKKHFIFFFDEPELSFHPSWQKRYLQEIQILLDNLDEKFHFIFTSHSPFLLSDIPKQNIIFLDKDENGNCKVVDGLKEKKQTFGANIHTLLSDSFFMEDGLMGEFAKSKIDRAIKLLNQEQLSEDELKYCEQIISIIGEPIVKNQLQRMLDSKRLKKVDKIDAIEKDIEVLKAELLRLKND